MGNIDDKPHKLKACPHLRGFFNTCIGEMCQMWDDERTPPDCGLKQLHPGQERHVIEVVPEPEIMPGTKKIYTTKGSRTKKV